jgi:hypothetical protein
MGGLRPCKFPNWKSMEMKEPVPEEALKIGRGKSLKFPELG